ncbi:restriction endonuclease subunit S [Endozoicomonas atrinae]|uniref:restriction endonuclease subunit S n=1 Tax=Endozoicomonas atrinae TaxID=1333660 RepID=UPI003AFFF1D5
MSGNSLERTKYGAYPEYKDSGVEWLGSIPESWVCTSLKRYCEVTDGSHHSPKIRESGLPFISVTDVGNDAIDFENCKKISESDFSRLVQEGCRPSVGDVLLTKDGTIGRAALVKEEYPSFVILSSLGLLTPTRKLLNTYLYYYLISGINIDQMNSLIHGSALRRMTISKIDELVLILPSVGEQKKIANFLDHETAKIDTLIEEQQSLIRLLKEKRQAVISHAVTKGLNPDAPMKDSGVEWLGEVPEHWKVCSLKFQFESQDYRRIPLSSEDRGNRSGEYRYYGASGVIDYIDDYIFDEPNVLVGEDGANLLARSTPLAFPAYGQYWVNNHAHILKPDDGLADYWAEVIERIDITPLVSGSAQPKLTAEALGNIIIAFPESVDERIQIDEYIKSQKAKYDQLRVESEQQVKLLQERRTALISAAVTGKIDVRGWQALVEKEQQTIVEAI